MGRPYSREELDRALWLHEHNQTWEQIGYDLLRNPQSLSRKALAHRRGEVNFDRSEASDRINAAIELAIEAGIRTGPKIAKACGVSIDVAYARMYRLGHDRQTRREAAPADLRGPKAQPRTRPLSAAYQSLAIVVRRCGRRGIVRSAAPPDLRPHIDLANQRGLLRSSGLAITDLAEDWLATREGQAALSDHGGRDGLR